MNSIRIGAVVRDSHRRIGIVCSKEQTPTRAWIGKQEDPDKFLLLGPAEWWGVMPLDGGYALEAGPLLTFVRDATYEDFLQAADAANVAGRETLAKMFPDFVDRLLASRASSGGGGAQ